MSEEKEIFHVELGQEIDLNNPGEESNQEGGFAYLNTGDYQLDELKI